VYVWLDDTGRRTVAIGHIWVPATRLVAELDENWAWTITSNYLAWKVAAHYEGET